MRELMLQDWLMLLHTSTTGPVVQTEEAWLDTSPYQDAVAWLEVKGITPASISPGNPLHVLVETSPVKDDAFFKPLCTFAISGTPPTIGVSVVKALLRNLPTSTTPPISAWTRWKVKEYAATFDWSITFRLWLAASSGCQ